MTNELPQVGGADFCVLTTPDMAPIWTNAVQATYLESRFRVVELPPSRTELSKLLDGARILVLDNPLWRCISHLGARPNQLVMISENWEIEEATPALDGAGYVCYRHLPFQAELFGAHSIVHRRVSLASPDGADKMGPVAFVPTHGPGAGPDGQMVLWNSEAIVGRGVRVSRDDPAVIEETFRATVGHAPLWVQPQFPFLIPRSPSTFKSLDGEPVQGLLCSSYERAGGWVVLTRRDVLDLLGHPGDVPWSRIPDLIGVQAAAALLSWLVSSASTSSSTSGK